MRVNICRFFKYIIFWGFWYVSIYIEFVVVCDYICIDIGIDIGCYVF